MSASESLSALANSSKAPSSWELGVGLPGSFVDVVATSRRKLVFGWSLSPAFAEPMPLKKSGCSPKSFDHLVAES